MTIAEKIQSIYNYVKENFPEVHTEITIGLTVDEMDEFSKMLAPDMIVYDKANLSLEFKIIAKQP